MHSLPLGRRLSTVMVCAMCLTLAPGCVKIQTGQTEQEAQESAAQRAQGLKAQWADRLQRTAPQDTPEVYLEYFEQVSSTLQEYGQTVLEQWRQGETAGDTTIQAGELRQVIDQWLTNQRHILRAWEDNLEYGRQYIEDLRRFDKPLMAELGTLLDLYYDIYSQVLLPDGTSYDYATALDNVRLQVAQKSEELRRRWR
ncbi:MAG: hypothetical protein ABIE70_10610 [bacterium]